MITTFFLPLDCCNQLEKVKKSYTEKGSDMKNFLGAFRVEKIKNKKLKYMQTGSSSDRCGSGSGLRGLVLMDGMYTASGLKEK